MHIKELALFVAAMFVLTACQLGSGGPSAKDLAATTVADTAKTAEAVPPTETPVPPPTETSVPVPTATITPTSEPTLTATPSGPLTFKDEFAKEDKDAWECTKCKWEGGALVLGPYDPGTNVLTSLNYNVCKACGAHIYYHFKVEANFIEGQVDRFFGVIAGIVDKTGAIYLGISPYQYYTLRDYNFASAGAKELAFKQSGVVSASRGTNTFEVDAKPGAKGTVDFYFSLNGKRLYVLNGKPAVPSMVGLGMSFHAVTVAYDNFEYEETAAP
jgi:hypothetical protein